MRFSKLTFIGSKCHIKTNYWWWLNSLNPNQWDRVQSPSWSPGFLRNTEAQQPTRYFP